jgi:hypothetical protein
MYMNFQQLRETKCQSRDYSVNIELVEIFYVNFIMDSYFLDAAGMKISWPLKVTMTFILLV